MRDAQLLFADHSYGHALSLAILALEEHGKKIFISAVKKKATEMDRELWKAAFRKHDQKVAMSFRILTETLIVKVPQEELDRIYETIPEIDQMKQRGLYVDYFQRGWHSASDADLKKAARTLIPRIKHTIQQTDKWMNF